MQNSGTFDPSKAKAAGRVISMLIGLVLSFFQSLFGQLRSGHFSLPGWLVSLAVSLLISWLIGYIIPMRKVMQNVCTKCKCPPGSLKARMAESLVSDLIFTPFITLANVFLAWRSAVSAGAGIPFLPMYLSSLAVSLVLGFVLIFLFQPLCKNAVLKAMAGRQPGKSKE